MDGSSGGGQAQPALQQQQKTALIRAEQVRQLPHLKEEDKAKYQRFIENLYTSLRTNPSGTPEHQKTYNSLLQISQKLMTDMKRFREEQQLRAREAQANGPNASLPQQTQFNQLYPQVQAKVDNFKFAFPPRTDPSSEGGITWLKEAKIRMGQALQKNEIGRQKSTELTKEFQERQASGNPLTTAEIDAYNAKQNQCKKYMDDSRKFINQFQQQQVEFRDAARQQALQRQQALPAIDGNIPGAPPGHKAMPTQAASNTQGPTAHTISTAVSAARNANTAQQTAGSPINATGPSQPGSAVAGTPQQNQVPFGNATQQADVNGSGNTGGQPQISISRSGSQGGPGAPPTFGNMSNIQPNAHHTPSSATHAHPPGYLGGAGAVKKDAFPIAKNLNHVQAPRPVGMPSSRPTLTGSSGHVVGGPLGQPALPKMPGYVLESSEDGRLLSRKKLDELVREITGIDAEQLAPEVEEVRCDHFDILRITIKLLQVLLAVADEFVDDLLTASCRIAKLRGSQQLEASDIQLILERNYNIRVPGYTSDDLRIYHHRKQPASSWSQKMGAVTAAKVTGGGNISAGANGNGAGGKEN